MQNSLQNATDHFSHKQSDIYTLNNNTLDSYSVLLKAVLIPKLSHPHSKFDTDHICSRFTFPFVLCLDGQLLLLNLFK